MKIPLGFFLLFFVASFFSVAANPANSKNRVRSLFPLKNSRAGVTKDQLDRFERQLTDYFSAAANKTNALAPAVSIAAQRPSQADFFLIARYWNFFSPAFKALYLKSEEIDPAMNHSYVSPGGHFEIYYTVTGKYAVATTDSYGYKAADWREKDPSPNRVPDYIDEVAWALDSAWSMEVDGFGFVKPIVYVDPLHGSNRYKVEVDIAAPDDSADYGLTVPMMSSNASGVGSASILQIRNNWAGFSTDSIDYSRHPELAVRVTCVHEFFHAIQYSMTWKLNELPTQYLDDIPVSWLEGTASLMENIGFDSVNDYLQYVDYFSENPNSTILNDDPTFQYTTVLLAMFLYEHALAAPSIEFIKKIFFNNYNKPLDFLVNLDSTAKSFNTTWPELLGRFYTESYFMGDRSRPGYFVHDAPLFDAWSLDTDSLDIAYSIRKNVPAYGMETFSITKANYPYDNLSMDFFGDTLVPSAPAAFWSIHCLLKKSDGAQDSVFSIPISSRSRASASISKWPAFDTAIFVVANSQGNSAKNAALVFQPCPISLHKGESATFICQISRPISAGSAAQVSVVAREDLACSLSIQSVSATSTQRVNAANERLVPVNVYYEMVFPLSWSINAAMALDARESASACLPLENLYGIGARAFTIFKWDETARTWVKSGAIVDTAGGIYSWHGAVTGPGTYGLFGTMPVPLDSQRADSIVVFPNPVHIKSGPLINIHGVTLLELLLYNVTGNLIYRVENSAPGKPMQWNLTNARGRTVAPGTYYAVIGYEDLKTKGMKKLKRKVLVVP